MKEYMDGIGKDIIIMCRKKGYHPNEMFTIISNLYINFPYISTFIENRRKLDKHNLQQKDDT